MSRKLKIIFVILPAGLALVLFALLFLADKWLESSAGRNQLELALTRSLGMPVHVRGDFNITFLPSLGVSGTDLLIGDEEGERPFVESETFHAELELLPLIEKKAHILAFSAAHGFLDPSQFRELTPSRNATSKPDLELPRIKRLLLEDFTIALAQSSVLVQEFELREFHPGVASSLGFRFSINSGDAEIATITARTALLVSSAAENIDLEIRELDIESETQRLEAITGDISWSGDQHLLEIELDGQRPGFGAATLSASLHTDSMTGALALDFLAQGITSEATARVTFSAREQGIEFPTILVSFDGQQADGKGCFLSGEQRALNLTLKSEYIDLDQMMPLFSGGGEGTGDGIPLELNLKFSVRELHAAGAIAHNSEISAGKQPDCSFLPD